jgi:HK97 family phage major capsid protein/HK97 family phage prohead protease
MKEYRFFPATAIRASDDGKRISGYAAVFDQKSDDLGGFREIVRPGAFKRCLDSGPDVRCLFNHDSNIVLGRTKSGTLRLSTDSNGLSFNCDVPNTQAGRDIRESIRRGDIDQCSFGFVVNKDNWREAGADGNSQSIRELVDVELFDVSPVTYAAYPQTSVSARLLWPEGEPPEVRTHRRADTKPARRSTPSAASPVSRSSTPVSVAEQQEILDSVNRRLGVPVSKSNSLEVRTMRQSMTPAAKAELRRYLATGRHEQRDMNTGGAASAFNPEEFNEYVYETMKATDAVFEACTHIESDTGGPLDLFALDDTSSASSILGEAVADSEQDPGLGRIQLAEAPTWDTGVVRVTWALLRDSGADIESMLAKAFAVRHSRGLGASLVTTLLAASELGATASGSAANTGGTENGSTSIGTADLVALRSSVDPAYRAAGAWWLMNDSTLAFLDGLLDKQGRPVLPQTYVNGRRMIMNFPVGICPSLANIGPGAIPILFGATGYFVLRTVKSEGQLLRLQERYIEYLETGFKSFLRANAALLCASGASSPVKYLANAAS